MADLSIRQAMIVFIRCPHWYCSMRFRAEREMSEHYQTAHRNGEPFPPKRG